MTPRHARFTKNDSIVMIIVVTSALPASRYMYAKRSNLPPWMFAGAFQQSLFTKATSTTKPTTKDQPRNDATFILRTVEPHTHNLSVPTAAIVKTPLRADATYLHPQAQLFSMWRPQHETTTTTLQQQQIATEHLSHSDCSALRLITSATRISHISNGWQPHHGHHMNYQNMMNVISGCDVICERNSELLRAVISCCVCSGAVLLHRLRQRSRRSWDLLRLLHCVRP